MNHSTNLSNFSECIFEALPVDMMLLIIKRLRLKDINNFYKVSKYTHEVIKDNENEIRSKRGHLTCHPNGTFERVFEKDPNFKQKISFHEGNQTSYLDQPSSVDYYEGKIISQKWYRKSKLHRTTKDENGFTFPAIICFENEKVSREGWYFNGNLHRTDKDENGVLPALIYYKGEEKQKMNWFKGGKAHRLDVSKETGLLLPSEIIYNDNQCFEKFHIFGKVFQSDFPLVIERAFKRHLQSQK